MSELDGVRDGYDRWAEIYDTDGNPLTSLEEPVVHEAVGNVAGTEVLDLGCGTGRHSLWLAAGGARVTAVDFSPGMLAAAAGKPGAEHVRFVVHDLHEPLPFEPGSFELVVSGLVLEHLRALPDFFAEIARCLRPGGRAVLSAMHPAMFLRGKQAAFDDPVTGESVRPGSLPHSIADFVNAAVGAGLTVEGLSEHSPDEAHASRYPRAAKYVGWPLLVVLRLQRAAVRS